MDTPLEKKETMPVEQTAPPVKAGILARIKSDKNFWMFMLIVVFGFFLAAAVFAFFINPRKKSPIRAKNTPPLAAPAVKTEKPASSVPATPIVSAAAPAAPVSSSFSGENEGVPSMLLTGILYSEEGSLALIDGKVVSEGGSINGATVTRIGSDEVELTYEGQAIVLRSR